MGNPFGVGGGDAPFGRSLIANPLEVRAENTPIYNINTGAQYLPNTVIPFAGDPKTVILKPGEPVPTPAELLKKQGFAAGWAPKPLTVTPSAETGTRRRKATNPVLNLEPVKGNKNPFIIQNTPEASLFGLNIPGV